jgi:branched-chain amino acid aminotransferase
MAVIDGGTRPDASSTGGPVAVDSPDLVFQVTPSTSLRPPAEVAQILRAPGFGRVFTDHMVTIRWTRDRGWHDAQVRPYAPLPMDPATMVFHYGQAIFEGFKAYQQPDGSIATFRPGANADRMNRSAARLALPALPPDAFIKATDRLVALDRRWISGEREMSLYLRPLMFATEVGLGVRPANDVTFVVIASPSGAYFAQGLAPVSIWLSEQYTRAAPGGTGAAKAAGNYAASLVAQQEAIDHGCQQVCFLDAVERRWIEELGGMNLVFVYDDGSLVTPELSGSILAGITRESLLMLAEELGHKAVERRIDVNEWRSGVEAGHITEVFACGTAATVSPLGRLAWSGGELEMPQAPGPVTLELRRALLDVQYGVVADSHGWLHRVP